MWSGDALGTRSRSNCAANNPGLFVLIEKLWTARKTWAERGFFALLRMTPSKARATTRAKARTRAKAGAKARATTPPLPKDG